MKIGVLVTALIATAIFTGCATTRQTDQADGPPVAAAWDIAVFSSSDPSSANIVLIDGTADAPSRAMHVRMFWRPRAGHTPMDPSATNSTVTYMLFEDNKVAVYGGGGLLKPSGKLTRSKITARLANATLRLMDKTESFTGRPKHARANGSITAIRDSQQTLALLHQLQTVVSGRLGYPRIVDNSNVRSAMCDLRSVAQTIE